LLCTLLHVLHTRPAPSTTLAEEFVAFSYNQVFWPNITQTHPTLMESALDFVEEESLRRADAVFVFNRFHLSVAVATLSTVGRDEEVTYRYEQLKKASLSECSYPVPDTEKKRMDALYHQERLEEIDVWEVFLNRLTTDIPYLSLEGALRGLAAFSAACQEAVSPLPAERSGHELREGIRALDDA
jgi:hypothetical protein